MKQEQPDAEPISRRRFALCSAATAAAALIPVAALAKEPELSRAEKCASFAVDVAPIVSKPEDVSDADWAETQMRYGNLLRVYGERLSPEQRDLVKQILLTNQRMLASIRRFELQNGDASACTLRLAGLETSVAAE